MPYTKSQNYEKLIPPPKKNMPLAEYQVYVARLLGHCLKITAKMTSSDTLIYSASYLLSLIIKHLYCFYDKEPLIRH